MRISELAKSLGVKSAEIIAELKKIKVMGKTASSNIDEEHIPLIKKNFGGKTSEAPAAKTANKKTVKTAGKKTAAPKPAAKKAGSTKPSAQKEPEADPAIKQKEEAEKLKEEAEKAAREKAKKEAELKAKREAELKAEEEARIRKKEEEAKAKKEAELKKRKEEEELRELERLVEQEEKAKKEAEAKAIVVDEAITVKEFAEKLNLSAIEIIRKLFLKGIAVTVNQTIGVDLAQEIAQELGYTIKVKPVEEKEVAKIDETADSDQIPIRPPVVTVMGHVDHGKTSLLDRIRKTDVAGKEAGGITQHIGAYSVKSGGGSITFLDTPGHEAFTALRGRGAEATDLVILVVAADDGVMPQTIEAINHAKAAEVMIIVAINKIDKPGAQPDKIKQDLTQFGLVPEDWGGTTIFCNVSAKTGQGIEELLEMVQLQAEVMELRAEPNQTATATVIESKLDKHRGPVHSIIVNKGTLRVGDPFVMGLTYGKVKAMTDDKGQKLKTAGPSQPLELLGATGLCDAGEIITVVESDRKARQIGENRVADQRDKRLSTQHVRLENVVERISDGSVAELKLVLKADAQGSVDAVKELLSKLGLDEVKIHVIHSGVGGITESDISLADASDAIVIGFNVRPTDQAKELAETAKIDLRLYDIIYQITDDVTAAVKGLLKPKFEEKTIGRAEVRNTFKISRIGTIAGCMVTLGVMRRNGEVRLIRDNVVIHTGPLSSLKRFKDDAKEVQNGYECGISLEKYNDIKVGDIFELFAMEEIPRED